MALYTLAAANILDQKQIRVVRDVELFVEDGDGGVRMNNIALSPGKATALLCTITSLASAYIGWILFGADAGLSLITQALGTGMVLGNAAGYVLHRSFRLWPILEKLEGVGPWLFAETRARQA